MIILPSQIWDSLLLELRKGLRRVERVAFLDGVETAGHQVATTLTIPNAKLSPHCYSITPAAMAEAGRHLFDLGLVRIAQVHTHPGSFIDHSSHDDKMAYSRHDGALSIVLPHYGRKDPTLASAGVHVCQAGQWRRVAPGEVENRIRIVPSMLSFKK